MAEKSVMQHMQYVVIYFAQWHLIHIQKKNCAHGTQWRTMVLAPWPSSQGWAS